jgi:hypothetical protein
VPTGPEQKGKPTTKGTPGPVEKPVAEEINSRFLDSLKVHMCEIFDCSDFHDFYAIKSLWGGVGGNFGVKMNLYFY